MQIDWERPATYDLNTEEWTVHTVQRSLLAELTETVAEAYARPLSSVDHPKPVIQLHFDYGQYAFGSAGGNEGPKLVDVGAYFCQSDKPAAACTLESLTCNVDADCLGTQSCVQGWCECADDFDCPVSTVCMESVCRPDGCAGHPCIYDDEAHVYDPALGPASVNGDFTIADRYNLETLLRGPPGGTFAFMPRNRRGLVVELWLGALSDVSAEKFFSLSTCCAIGEDCYDPLLERYYGVGCKDVFPGYIEWDNGAIALTGEVSCGAVSCGKALAPSLMHELGHALRLGHAPPELDPTTSCVTDRDCYELSGEIRYCAGGMCMVRGNKLPNHVSSMSGAYGVVDTEGHIDYSSGLRPTLQIMQDVGPCDAACVAVGDPDCKLPPELAGGLLPPDPCCYADRCVDGGLNESVGIGDLYGTGGNDYSLNRDFQLSSICGGGVSPIHPLLDDAGIDWDDDGLEDAAPVARALLEGPNCNSSGPGDGYFRAIPDIDEWSFIDELGFQFFGINLLFSIGSNGYCGTAEGVSCPPGYACERGFCRIGWVPGLPVDFSGLDEPEP